VNRRRRVWIDPADRAVTVAEWVARWFRSLDLDPRMIESYRSRLRCHILPKFGALPLGAITALSVTEWPCVEYAVVAMPVFVVAWATSGYRGWLALA
jgi:hypothetical protein